MDVLVNEHGSLEDTYIVESMGEGFVEALTEADWEPAEHQGEYIESRKTIEMEFASDFNQTNQKREPEPVSGMEAIYNNLEYPETARESGIEGVIVMAIEVGEDGYVTDARVQQEIGDGTSEAAIEAIETTNWEPAIENGTPVASTMQMPIRFQLLDDEQE